MNIHPQTYTINIRLNNIIAKAQEMFNSNEVGESIETLNVLLQKFNFLSKNGKHFDPILQVICYYNLGCAYQSVAFKKNSQDAIDQCLSNLEKAIELTKTKVQGKGHEQYEIKLKGLLAKMELQYCALLSQIQIHDQALKYSIYALNTLHSVIDKGYKECIKKLQQLNKQKIDKQKNISFAHRVLVQSKSTLSELTQLQTYEQIMGKNVQDYSKLKRDNYFWKDNFENNQKLFRRQIQNKRNQQKQRQQINEYSDIGSHNNKQIMNKNTNRSLLGLRVNNSWLQQVTIGNIMRMNCLNYSDFLEPDNIVYEFSQRNIIQKVILVSIVYFSIATQMRYKEQQSHKAQAVHKKCKNLKQKQLRKSQIFHLKSIELVCKFIKENSPIVDHLINSYLKHYYNLIQIMEQPSFAEQSAQSSQIQKYETLKTTAKAYEQNKQYLINNKNTEVKPTKKKQENRKKMSVFNFRKSKKVEIVDLNQETKGSKKEKGSKSKYKLMHRDEQRTKKNEKSFSSSQLTHVKSLHSFYRSSLKGIKSKDKDALSMRILHSPQPSLKRQKQKYEKVKSPNKSMRKTVFNF